MLFGISSQATQLGYTICCKLVGKNLPATNRDEKVVSGVWERVESLDVWVREVSRVWQDNIAIPTHGDQWSGIDKRRMSRQYGPV